MTVYLLHYASPIGGDHHHAQHYLGSSANLPKRLDQHARGRSGAGIVRAFAERGIAFVLARTWEGGKPEERRLKNWKKARQLCPICRGTGEPIEWQPQPDTNPSGIPF